MIPTVLLLGLLLGRWWRLALVAAAVGWPLVLVATGVTTSPRMLLGAAALAVANAGLGVLVHQAGLHTYRRLRHRAHHPTSG